MTTPERGLFERIRANIAVKGSSADACVHMMQIQKICEAHDQRLREAEAERDKYKADSLRLQYLTADLAGDDRITRNDLLGRMAVMSYSAASRDIDTRIAELTTPQPEKKV
jgi:hypothetical protein